jgi:hypothetical protein
MRASSPVERLLRPPALPAALIAFTCALLFALVTDHVWEDYYITYRASKNLAEGHGLVFNPGDRLHTFTSPLGTLLPAAASYATGGRSDAAALWIYRVLSAAALGGAAWLLVRALARTPAPWLGALLPAAWLVTDAKTLDFTINGMETAFMLLFLAYAVWAHLQDAPRRWLHLGLAWAGLMWTRPDSFIYIGLIAAGFWIFHDASLTGRTRRQLFRDYLLAGLVTTLVYLPWLLIATAYYGTPVPHTVTAKGTIGGPVPHTLPEFARVFFTLPYLAWRQFTSLETTFLPSYYMIGGWPPAVVVAGRALATLASVLWLVPRLPAYARAASFAFFGAHVYLTFFPYFPFPWYIPNSALLAALALGGLVAALAAARSPLFRGAAAGLALFLVADGAWLTWEVARQVRVQQQVVEEGGRRQIGEWLKANSQPGDSVFMEPLGYIGYFSGLKTYDFPGMSSREMVEARRLVGNDWAQIIGWLQPTFLVLRPHEAERVAVTQPFLLGDNYARVAEFNVLPELRAHAVRGRSYLEHDAHFLVYRLQRPTRYDTEVAEIRSEFPPSDNVLEGVGVKFLHAPARLAVIVPEQARSVRLSYGFSANCWESPAATDGADYLVDYIDGPRRIAALQRTLQPTENPGDRALQHFEFELPPRRGPRPLLLIRIEARGHKDKDWTNVSIPEFR